MSARRIDFSDAERRKKFATAKRAVTDAYRVMRTEVGVDNPSDNAFLREATICASQALIWMGDRGGVDATTAAGNEVEIKSTRLDERPTIAFPTSRYVSPTVIARFRAAEWFLFGVFDLYEEMVGLYRVDRGAMSPLIDVLETKMRAREAAGRPYENNPKFSFHAVRSAATVLEFDAKSYEELQVGRNRRWTIRARPGG